MGETYIKIVKGTPVLYDDINNQHKYLLGDTTTVKNLEQLFDLIENNYYFRPWIQNRRFN